MEIYEPIQTIVIQDTKGYILKIIFFMLCFQKNDLQCLNYA